MKNTPKFWLVTLVMLFSISAWTQVSIRGKITSQLSGEPLEWATILVKDFQQGTVAGPDGIFNITVDTLPVVLVASYVGFETQELLIEDASSLDVELVLFWETADCLVFVISDIPIQIAMPAPFMQLHQKQLQRDNDITIVHALNRVPGVYMHSGALNTNRLTIRGIGNRSLFSTTKIRAYLDDIPLTSGDGETTIEDIDLSIVDKVDVWKGPTASIYGAGLGGMIHLRTGLHWNLGEENFISSKITLGSYGLLRNTTDLFLTNKKHTASFRINYNNTHSDGYRDNNEYDREGITVLGKLKSNEKNQTTLLVDFKQLKSFIPSSLSQIDYDENPQKAAFSWGNINGFEDYEKGLMGISHRVEMGQIASHYLNNKTSIFYNFRDAYESRPFNILDENTQTLGLRTSFELNKENHSNQAFPNLSIGMELFKESYKWQTFVTNDGDVGDNLSDNFEQRYYINLFVQTYQNISDHWTILAGLNMNRTNYNYEDRFFADTTDLSGDYAFDLVVSPQLGLTYQSKRKLALFATVSHGFSTPTLEETLTPDGGINPTIQPEKGWNLEVGTRGVFWNRCSYELTVYQMQVKDLLVAERAGADQFVGINAGETRHRGLEFFGSYQMLNNRNKLSAFVTYTFKDYVFVDFVSGANIYSGNKLTGTSPHHLNIGMDADLKNGLYGNVNFQFVDAFPMRDDNSIESDAYHITNLKIGYKKLFKDRLQLNIYGGIQNIFDEKYASMILINASSFGGNPPRYYYPGRPRNYFGGTQLKWYF